MKLNIDDRIVKIIKTLQTAGYETYIVGGAVRDMLLGHIPKDYDISTAATPEEICQCFSKRQTMIIGKRFKLVHYRLGKEIIEISTFRSNPEGQSSIRSKHHSFASKPENMIFDDNNFGTAKEDAFRRDFTVNALFYDPVKHKIIDYTEQGLHDIENKIVRVIGNGNLRFEEDPVRMLRALKLVGQFDFIMDNHTENALFNSLDYLRHVSISRMTLELEKILASCYGDRLIETFHDYGLLKYFLPFFDAHWGTKEMERSLDLLCERNIRVSHGLYRNSVSLAMATLLYPFVEHEYNSDHASRSGVKINTIATELVSKGFKPQTMIKRLLFSAEKILISQFSNRQGKNNSERSSAHAYELMNIIKSCK